MGKRLLPVIHVVDEAQALAQVKVARDAGADGVWLIGHAMPALELRRVFMSARRAHGDFWLGINFLDLTGPKAMMTASALTLVARVDGLWTDNADPGSSMASLVWGIKQREGWTGQYFGGVAFKYQREVKDVAAAAVAAMACMDVVTTSGDATGEAARIEKIAMMKRAIGSFPLAIASGISPENVGDYLPHVDCFLVATGISRDFHELDPGRTRTLANLVHG
jgi:hypothetical protein